MHFQSLNLITFQNIRRKPFDLPGKNSLWHPWADMSPLTPLESMTCCFLLRPGHWATDFAVKLTRGAWSNSRSQTRIIGITYQRNLSFIYFLKVIVNIKKNIKISIYRIVNFVFWISISKYRYRYRSLYRCTLLVSHFRCHFSREGRSVTRP